MPSSYEGMGTQEPIKIIDSEKLTISWFGRAFPKVFSTSSREVSAFVSFWGAQAMWGNAHCEFARRCLRTTQRPCRHSLRTSCDVTLQSSIVAWETSAPFTISSFILRRIVISLVAPYGAILRYYRCDTPYRAMLFREVSSSSKMV